MIYHPRSLDPKSAAAGAHAPLSAGRRQPRKPRAQRVYLQLQAVAPADVRREERQLVLEGHGSIHEAEELLVTAQSGRRVCRWRRGYRATTTRRRAALRPAALPLAAPRAFISPRQLVFCTITRARARTHAHTSGSS